MPPQKIAFWFVAGLVGCSQPLTKTADLIDAQWLDLRHSYDQNTLYWPNNSRGFEHVTEAEGNCASTDNHDDT